MVLLVAMPGAGDAAGGAAGAPSLPAPGAPSKSPGSVAPATLPGPRSVCDSPALAGPATPPAGAVTVTPGTDLAAHPAGTTYWLAPGTHSPGSGEYDQIVPEDGDTFVGAPGAVLDGRRTNRYAFSGQARGVTVAHLTVQDFGPQASNNNEGVVNHDSAPGWTVRDNTLQRNAGAAVMIGSGNRVLRNCLRGNGQYGFNAYHPDGVADIVLAGNEITGNNTDDWERRIEGCGCTGGGKFWATVGAKVTGNHVHDNRGVGLWADTNNSGFLFEGNHIAGNDAEGLFYETSYNAAIVRNVFVRNAIVKGPTNPGFPASAIYLSEAGSDPRAPGPYGERLLVSGNTFVDNWSGIIAWENADRFAGSPANTSSGTATLVNPRATVTACATPALVASKPYLDDCRWKTQNVLVEDNTFALDREQVSGCRASRGCGFNGVFSNYGTYPDFSPYRGDVISERITFGQNNLWRNNTYRGTWGFVARSAGNLLDWDTWRAAPYGQDGGSTLRTASRTG
jgi:hypothetical protein